MDFEQWYTTHCFDLGVSPMGGRDCGLQRSAWNAAIEAAANTAEEQGSEPECPERAQYCADAIRALSSNAALSGAAPTDKL